MTIAFGQATSIYGTICAVAMPALVGLTLYHVTGDPRLQPLGLTEERMTRIPPPVEPGLVQAELHVPAGVTDTDGLLYVARQIKKTFTAKGQDAWVVVLRDPQAKAPFVVYRIGSNTLGPYALGQAAQGVAPALIAVRTIRENS